MTVYEKILARLREAGVVFETSHHDPTRTSEDAARIRGVALASGAKALVLCGSKTKTHALFVMPANRKLDSKKVRTLMGEDCSFAPDPEIVTGCVPGSVPPFGSILGLKTFVDPRLKENEHINFNAGSLTDSVRMRYDDYVRVEQPVLAEISKEAPSNS